VRGPEDRRSFGLRLPAFPGDLGQPIATREPSLLSSQDVQASETDADKVRRLVNDSYSTDCNVFMFARRDLKVMLEQEKGKPFSEIFAAEIQAAADQQADQPASFTLADVWVDCYIPWIQPWTKVESYNGGQRDTIHSAMRVEGTLEDVTVAHIPNSSNMLVEIRAIVYVLGWLKERTAGTSFHDTRLNRAGEVSASNSTTRNIGLELQPYWSAHSSPGDAGTHAEWDTHLSIDVQSIIDNHNNNSASDPDLYGPPYQGGETDGFVYYDMEHRITFETACGNGLVVRSMNDWTGNSSTYHSTAAMHPDLTYDPQPLMQMSVDESKSTDGGTEPDPTGPTDGEPPSTTPNPAPAPDVPLTPIGGGCRATLDGPASCNWTVPTPDIGDFPMPGDLLEDMPVFDVTFPDFPPFDCTLPDFGNMDPCGPGSAGPGMGGPLPGGRDRTGKAGSGNAGVKTGGKTQGPKRKKTFGKKMCPGKTMPWISCFTVITQLLMDVGIQAVDIIFQVGAEWDKPFPRNKCFARGSRIFDAAQWTARYLMLTIIDEGPPTNNVYIGPPWHRPGQRTWTFHENIDLFNLSRAYNASESYYAVEVFGPRVGAPVLALVDTPFDNDPTQVLRVEVGPNYSRTDAIRLARTKAAAIRREAVSVQATVPYSTDYMMRDKMILRCPSRGFEETYIIFGKESDISFEGYLHVLTGVLPATVAEMEQFPKVAQEYTAEAYA
jgi:hypothetical protein